MLSYLNFNNERKVACHAAPRSFYTPSVEATFRQNNASLRYYSAGLNL